MENRRYYRWNRNAGKRMQIPSIIMATTLTFLCTITRCILPLTKPYTGRSYGQPMAPRKGTHLALDIAPGPFGSGPQYIMMII